jgi:hypothetical protein
LIGERHGGRGRQHRVVYVQNMKSAIASSGDNGRISERRRCMIREIDRTENCSKDIGWINQSHARHDNRSRNSHAAAFERADAGNPAC